MDQTSTPPAITINHLTRIYDTTVGVWRRERRQIVALDDISLSIPAGETFGVIGPNGAGKTTLIKVLCTMLLPTSGQVRVLDFDVAHQEKRVRERINVVFGGEQGLYTRLSGVDNLRYFADLYRVPPRVARQRIDHLLNLVELTGREQERVEGYSKGMKQRLHIAKSLINDPDILFLDEPTIGLDPEAARKLRKIVGRLEEAGKTIVLTSHYMHEIDELCKRVAIINKGRLITLDTPGHLKSYVVDLAVLELQLVQGVLAPEVQNALEQLPQTVNFTSILSGPAQKIVVQTYEPGVVLAFIHNHIPPETISFVVSREPTLEDAYLKIVGGEM